MAKRTNGSKFDIYQVVTDKILEALDRDIMPWRKPWTVRNGRGAHAVAFHMNLVSKHHYRGINPFLLEVSALTNDWASPYWLTYNQVKEKKGEIKEGQARKDGGPGPTMVVFWKQTQYKTKPGQRCPKCHQGELNSNLVCDSCAKRTENAKSLLLRYYNVWNIEQTTIEPPVAPEPDETEEVKEFDPIAEAEAIIANMPNAPKVRYGFNGAAYSPTTDQVKMPDRIAFDSSESFYSTLFHEHVHATGSKSRLDRKDAFKGNFGDSDYAREELVAEMGAAMLCAMAGVDNELDQSASYIRNWMSKADYEVAFKADKKLVVIAAARAQKAADYILGDIPND